MLEWEELGDVRLLIVEDDPFNRDLLFSLFNQLSNMEIFEAANGLEALQVLQKEDIDIILLDIHMPAMNGFETLKALRNMPKYSFTPVIIITSNENEMKKSYELGADDFISKPFKAIELESRVYTHIKKGQYRKKYNELFEKMNREVIKKNTELLHTMKSIENSQKEFFYRLSILMNKKKNSKNNKIVATISKEFATLLGCSAVEASNVYYGAIIRDIGLFALSKEISPSYKFSQKDKEIYYQYIMLGYQVVNNSIETDFIKVAKKIISQYKENYDGTGFPRKLKKDQISQYAYIVAISETFDALLSEREYRFKKVHSLEETYKVINMEGGRRFKPIMTKIFLDNFEKFVKIREKMI